MSVFSRNGKRIGRPRSNPNIPALHESPKKIVYPTWKGATRKQLGELAEMEFMVKATKKGLIVAKPYGESHRYDFLGFRQTHLARAGKIHYLHSLPRLHRECLLEDHAQTYALPAVEGRFPGHRDPRHRYLVSNPRPRPRPPAHGPRLPLRRRSPRQPPPRKVPRSLEPPPTKETPSPPLPNQQVQDGHSCPPLLTLTLPVWDGHSCPSPLTFPFCQDYHGMGPRIISI